MAYCPKCCKEVECIRSWCSECGHNVSNVDRLFLNYHKEKSSSSENKKTSNKKDSRMFDFLSIAGNQFLS